MKKRGLNWTEEYLQHLKNKNDPWSSTDVDDLFIEKDNFIPEAIGQFEEGDLEEILLLLQQIKKSAYRVDYYIFYMHIVEKLATLLAEEYPEKFNLLDMEKKDLVFNAKTAIPDEVCLYKRSYIYLLYHRELPPFVFPTGLTFLDYLERTAMEKPELENKRLRDLIGVASDQYARYFDQVFSPENESTR